MELSKNTLLNALREEFAAYPGAPRSELIERATTALCKRLRLRTDADREDISGRMSAIWIEHFGITEPI